MFRDLIIYNTMKVAIQALVLWIISSLKVKITMCRDCNGMRDHVFFLEWEEEAREEAGEGTWDDV